MGSTSRGRGGGSRWPPRAYLSLLFLLTYIPLWLLGIGIEREREREREGLVVLAVTVGKG